MNRINALRLLIVCAVVLGQFGIVRRALALPPRGADAPPVRLPTLEGTQVNTADNAPKAQVIVFGEVGHEGCRKACGEVLDVMEDVRIDKANVVTMLVVAQQDARERLKEEAAIGRYPATILRDEKRESFGAYHILVVPTVVVVDGHAKVVHAMPGFVPRFRELLATAVLTAQGKMSQEEFNALADNGGVPAASPDEVRAERLVRLGRELVRHGLYDTAAEQYAEAMKIAPDSVDAKQSMGVLMLRQGKHEEASVLFRAILAKQPDSAAASLGLAEACVGSERAGGIAEAESLVESVLKVEPKNPRAHYLQGRILEAQGKNDGAKAEYRRAAELLIEGQVDL